MKEDESLSLYKTHFHEDAQQEFLGEEGLELVLVQWSIGFLTVRTARVSLGDVRKGWIAVRFPKVNEWKDSPDFWKNLL